jgi:hypothetical protein
VTSPLPSRFAATVKEARDNTALFRATKELLLSYTVGFVVNIYIYIYTVIVVVSSSIDIPHLLAESALI